MRSEPTVILEVDRRLAHFIQSSRPARPDRASPLELGRWHAALEVRRILQDACPYDASTSARRAWFDEKYGDAADSVIGEL
ncbi:hypothetical protein [Pseudorhodoferax sp. Leaf267]|uniref:hypothetical protein n=1 Tax=Pseudorhodoferax sp. Leaf267 TaxID=1736316 RepID=UPI0006FF1793|nr:hypothetical protein [Pseudorhodoferax sp. Leaf267]KQP22625.1 hypothetical protein ASF43_01525 [Pseudorhodoferax sp. Leaf267]